MLRKPDAKPSNQEANIVMNRTVDWPLEIAHIAGPMRPGDSEESWLERARKASGASFWHVKQLFKGKLKNPKYDVAYKILSAADKARIEEAKRDAAKLVSTYDRCAQSLANIDPDFHRAQIDALVNAARILGTLDSA